MGAVVMGAVATSGAAMDVLEELRSAVDAVVAADPARLGDRVAILALHRQLERLEAATTRATAAFDAGGAWEADGARSAAAWLATRARVAMPVARRRLRLGRALRHLPVAETAWLAGDIDAPWRRWPRRAHRRAMPASGATRPCWWSRRRA